jgi:Arc/MetJ family transcription regulator
MRTTLQIDDATLANLMLHTGAKSKSEAIRKAIVEYLHQQKKKEVIALRGKVDIEDNWEALRQADSKEL